MASICGGFGSANARFAICFNVSLSRQAIRLGKRHSLNMIANINVGIYGSRQEGVLTNLCPIKQFG
jgi:hypothetical protein